MATYTPLSIQALTTKPPVQSQYSEPIGPVKPKTSPTEISATDIGTEPVALPKTTTGTNPLASRLNEIQTQALAIQSKLGEMQQQASPQTPSGVPTPTTPTAPMQTPRQLIQQRMLETFGEGQQFDASALKQQEGFYQAEQELNAINNQMLSAAKETIDKINEMRTNPEGKLRGALEADIENYRYDRANYEADLAIKSMAVQGRYDSIKGIVDDAIAAEEQKYTRQMDFYRQMYTMLGDDMTDSEEKEYDSKMRMFEQQTKDLTDSKTAAARNASLAQAPAEVLTAIKNATTPEEVWLAAGIYGEDPGLRQNREQFQQTQGLAWAKFRWDQEYAMQKMALDQIAAQGTISAEQKNKAEAALAVERDAKKMQDAVTRVLANKTGFDAVTGDIKGSLSGLISPQTAIGAGGFLAGGPIGLVTTTGGAYFGMKEARQQAADFAADMNFLYKANIPDALRKAKEAGWTGTMTNVDIENIANGADALFSLWNPEKGNFGSASPERVKKAITDFQTVIDENLEKINNSPELKQAILGTSGSQIDNIFAQ